MRVCRVWGALSVLVRTAVMEALWLSLSLSLSQPLSLSLCVISFPGILCRSQTIVVPTGDELLVEATQGLREWRWKLRELYVVSRLLGEY